MQWAKGEFSDNGGYNALEFYNILVEVQFAISKSKLDNSLISYNKLNIGDKTYDLKKTRNIRVEYPGHNREI